MNLILLFCAFGSSGEESCEPVRLSFRQALRMARHAHVDVIIRNERVKQAVARIGQSGSPLLPQYTLAASQNRQTENLIAMGIDIPMINPLVGPFNSLDARMTLSQTLFDAAAIGRLRAACAGKKLSDEEWNKAKEDAMALVANFYIEAERAANAVQAARAVLARDEAKYRIEEKKLRIGTGSDIALRRSRAGLEDARSLLSGADIKAIETRLDLVAALGIPEDAPVLLEGEDDWTDVSVPKGSEIVRAKESNPDVSVAKALVEERRRERLTEWMELFPKFSGFMDYGASGETPAHADGTYTFGLKASFPVFEGGKTFFRIREAISRFRESKARLEDAKNQSGARILKAAQTIEEARSLMNAKESDLEVAEKQLALALHRLRTGIGSSFAVIEASARSALAEDALDEALATYRMAQVSLAHSMGELGEWIDQERIGGV